MEHHGNARKDPILGAFQSLIMGVRPMMNGPAIHQDCVIEFQQYFSLPAVPFWKTATKDYTGRLADQDHTIIEAVEKGFIGLSNDLVLRRIYGHTAQLNYGLSNKLLTNDITQKIQLSSLL